MRRAALSLVRLRTVPRQLNGPAARMGLPSSSALPTPPARSFTTTPTFQNQPKSSTEPILINGVTYPRDSLTNATPTILSKLPLQLHLQPTHPIGILRSLIESHLPAYASITPKSPIVTVRQNFDELGFPPDHPGRSKTDSYYLNGTHMLRTHTSAHEVEAFGKVQERWLLSADVYRRDEIDASHYPVFHQMEGADVLDRSRIDEYRARNEVLEKRLKESNIIITDSTEISTSNPYQAEHDPTHAELVTRNLKNTLNCLVLDLFGPLGGSKSIEGASNEPLQVRWIEAYFPWTCPSYEVEVFFQGKWLEILGCGVVRQDTLSRSGVPSKIGWAFGLGLERIAMVLFGIPDIRLFWSTDPRFLTQFKPSTISKFLPWSKFPSSWRDLSFWIPKGTDMHENDFCDLVRDVVGDEAEDVKKTDEFMNQKTGRKSLCFRITYRSLHHTLEGAQVTELHEKVAQQAISQFGVEIR